MDRPGSGGPSVQTGVPEKGEAETQRGGHVKAQQRPEGRRRGHGGLSPPGAGRVRQASLLEPLSPSDALILDF